MSLSVSKTLRRSLVSTVAATMLVSAVAAPAQAQVQVPTSSEIAQASSSPQVLSSYLPPQVAEALFLVFAVPVIGSSILSSMIGIPQCGLHDTRACPTG